MPPISSHGTLIARAPAATPLVFTTIGEIGDISHPGLMRNEHETSVHNRDIDSYIGGIMRRDPLTFPINYHTDDATHNEATGLVKAMIDNSIDGYMLTQPDGEVWLFSGWVQNFKPDEPVDGKQSAEVTIRPTGPFYLNGVLVSG